MNQQQIEKRTSRTDVLSVHSVFYTIQGEGPFCGTPAVFIRLAGCNLQCPACDTDYTSQRSDRTVNDLVREVRTIHHTIEPGLVVITGGEPFRQNISQLLHALVSKGYFVQIETNGSLEPSDYPYSTVPDIRAGAYIVVSPKAGKVHPKIAERACCYKYVMNAKDVDTEDGLPTRALGHACRRLARPIRDYNRVVYLQPQDDKNEQANNANLQAVIKSCMDYGYTLQLQVHKIIGME